MDEVTSSPPRAPPGATTTAASSPPRATTEEPAKEAETAKLPTPVASPARSAAQDEPHQGSSPGQGSGTKRAEEEGTRASVDQGATTMTRTSPPRANSPPPAQDTFPTSSRMPALESLSLIELHDEYFSRLSQHAKLESDLVKLMQQRHKVTMFLLTRAFSMFILVYCSPQATSFLLANELGARSNPEY